MITVELNRGHVMAELVRDSDPEGNAVVHAINRRQSMADKLYDERLIEPYQWQAACDLAELWAAARPVPEVAAVDLAQGSYGEGDFDINPRADHKLRRLARRIGKAHWTVIERLVYDNQDPREWGRRRGVNGLKLTRTALDALAKEMGLA